ncbi:MAG: hypothetical protein U0X93_17495 [Anaerolineales bacterium]
MKLSEKNIAITLLFVGAILRLRGYFSGRSLWADEAMLALNIVNRNFIELFKPLEYDQGAPLGFLLVEKFFNHAVRSAMNMVLRLFPLLAGLASLWLFYLLIRKHCKAQAFSSHLHYSRQSPIDLLHLRSKAIHVDALSRSAFSCSRPDLSKSIQQKELQPACPCGIPRCGFRILPCSSLRGSAPPSSSNFCRMRDYKNLRTTFGIGLLWLANLTLLYFINLRQLSHNNYSCELLGRWISSCLRGATSIGWLNSSSINSTFDSFPCFVSVLILVGWLALLREERSAALALAFTTGFRFHRLRIEVLPRQRTVELSLIPLGILLLGKAIGFLWQTFLREQVCFNEASRSC